MNLPSIKQLQYLLAVHKEQNFNRAAEACHISQSTLSVAINNLEELVGQQLIERDNRKLMFTAMGELVVEQARMIIDQSINMIKLIEADGDVMAGDVRLGCIPTIAPFLLPRLAKASRQEYPRLRLRLVEDTTAQLMSQLEKGEIDVAILALPIDTGSFHVMNVGKDRFKLVAHNKLKKDLEKLKDFTQVPDGSLMLLEKEHCLRGHALEACRLSKTEKIHPFEATSLTTLVTMLEDGEGLSFLPDMAIEAGLLKNTHLIALDMPFENAERQIGFIWRKTSFRAQCYRNIGLLAEKLLTLK
ncbi:hydrogen peroxide-inducible genes activator [Pleionea mediterranea]|jgi:LysR family hydrogen peroxide-inducible transcriptional activator|uniref:LysR family transcriptional regulator n=1 Tax=Pleionea mediterranea TaxID=523701 RepID=A0A316FVR1_9GAMM|nr:hydrogen peroxide-inducible genes activator [Pleionea mediterranea]PWK51690.1 LysR family transcriptional regulator [Pleionea mediterranea]